VPDRLAAADVISDEDLAEIAEEDAARGSTNEMLRLALISLLKQKKKIAGLVNSDDSDADDGLGPLAGSRHSMALEKLHTAMRRPPAPFATRMETLAADVAGVSDLAKVGEKYVADQLPVGKQKTLGYMAHLLGQIHTAAHEKDLDRVRFLSMAGITMAEQFSLDENWQTAWRMFGMAVPPWVDWAQSDAATLRREHAHARTADGRWVSAVVGAFKDEEVLRKKRGKGGGKDKDKDKGKVDDA